MVHSLELVTARPSNQHQQHQQHQQPPPLRWRRPALQAVDPTRAPTMMPRADHLPVICSTLVASALVEQGPDTLPPRKCWWQQVRILKATPTSCRITINLLTWWCLNVIFNLANKQCLNSWPHPWTLATLHLAIGSTCMLPLYLPLPRKRGHAWVPMRPLPCLTWADFRALLPVMALLAIGHVTSTLAPAYGTVAFSNIVKTAEPLFTCLFSFLLYRYCYL